MDITGRGGLAQTGCHAGIEGRHERGPVVAGDLQLAGAHQPGDHLAVSGCKAGIQIVGTGLGVGPHVGVRQIPQLGGDVVGVHLQYLHTIVARGEPDSVGLLNDDQHQPGAQPALGGGRGRRQKPRQRRGDEFDERDPRGLEVRGARWRLAAQNLRLVDTGDVARTRQ